MLQYIGLLDPLQLQDSDKVKTHLVKHQDFLSLSEFLSDFSASSDAVMYRRACIPLKLIPNERNNKLGCKFNKSYHFKDNMDLEALLLVV